jgi:hypothetical protein
MDHLHKIAAEIIQLYHKQLNLLLCKIAGLNVAARIDYDHGKERIQPLRRELEAMVRARYDV